jgi:O-antigen ligase
VPTSGGLLALAAALVAVAASALASVRWASLPMPLALSAVGTIGAALVAAWGGAVASRGDSGIAVFRAVCIALLVVGLLSVLIGLVQVFAPQLADGTLVAATAIEGRASGNLRQPNHLSSLLLWSLIAASWLAETGRLRRRLAAAIFALLVLGLVLSGSRTGMLGVGLLAMWGLLDGRLSRSTRMLLVATPVLYAVCWFGLSAWAERSEWVFGGQAHVSRGGDISSSRFAIWSDTLALIAQHPWLGVGFGEFNFAWSLTTFAHRPVAFFDHTHNLPLQFVVELGVPLSLLVLALLGWALWRAFSTGLDAPPARATMLRAAFMVVLTMVVHSMLEYPLWYAYFLLPTAFVFGLCLGADEDTCAPHANRRGRTGLTVASLLLAMGGALAVVDYLRVATIFAPGEDAPPLARRIADGQRSWLFAHHADYAAATTAEQPSKAMPSFRIATHYLLDTRLMMAWARALHESGDVERARHIAQRLREFRNDDSTEFFAACDEPLPVGISLPFQCTPPTRSFDYRDFR